jgi:hypothetical protein
LVQYLRGGRGAPEQVDVAALHSLAGLVLSAADGGCKVEKKSALLTASRQKHAATLPQTHE